MANPPHGGFTEESLAAIMKDLRDSGVRISAVPTRLHASTVALTVAEKYGLTVQELAEAVMAERRVQNRVYMRNYMRKRRNSRRTKIKDAVVTAIVANTIPPEVMQATVLCGTERPETELERFLREGQQALEADDGEDEEDGE